MTDSTYSWFYEEPFHSIFSVSTTTLSVFSNGLLLFIIFTTNSTAIGSYQYLLAVFATSDILASFAHLLLQPLMHMTTTGAYFFPRHGGIIIYGIPFDTIFCLAFVATYYQTFLILAYHYVYRWKTVTSNITCSFTDHWKSAQWISLAVAVYILYVTAIILTCNSLGPSDETRVLAPFEIRDIYGVDLSDKDNGFFVLAIRRPNCNTGELSWHIPTIVSLSLLIGEFGGTSVIILFCIWRINGVIKSTNNNLTAKTRQMQLNLFRALLVQTAVPILFSYVPLGTILVFPAVSGISLGAFGNVLFSITSIFPCIDAFFVLFFIKRFRSEVIRLFRMPFKSDHGSSVEHRSTAR